MHLLTTLNSEKPKKQVLSYSSCGVALKKVFLTNIESLIFFYLKLIKQVRVSRLRFPLLMEIQLLV